MDIDDDEVIDVEGREVPSDPVRIGCQITFTPSADIEGLFKGVSHLGLIIGTTRGRPILRIYSPLGKDATFEHTGSEGSWSYFERT
jgi:hypothetical protein